MRFLFRWILRFSVALSLVLGVLLMSSLSLGESKNSWYSLSVFESLPAPHNPNARIVRATIYQIGLADFFVYGFRYTTAGPDWPAQFDPADIETHGYQWVGNHDSSPSWDSMKTMVFPLYPKSHSYYAPIPVVAIALCLPAFFLAVFAIRKLMRRDLRMQTNLCLHCGYNLTGVESDKCPECGAARPLVTVSSAG